MATASSRSPTQVPLLCAAPAPADAGVVKPDTGASDAGPRNDDHSDARVGGSRLAPGQGIAGVLDGDDDADWFVFTAGAGDLHRVETRERPIQSVRSSTPKVRRSPTMMMAAMG